MAWFILLIGLSWIVPLQGLAAGDDSIVGQVEELDGKVAALSHPLKSLPQGVAADDSRSPYAFHDGSYWRERTLKKTDPVYLNDVISSGQDGRVKIRLKLGYDLVLAAHGRMKLGPALLERASLNEVGFVDLIRGKLRAIISEKHTQQAPVFRTKSAVIGIRGTDFMITTGHVETVVGVITGSVSLRSAISSLAPVTQTLGAGMTASVPAPPPAALLRETEKLSNEELAQALKAYLPTPPKAMASEQLKEIEHMSQGMGTKDTELVQLKEKIMAPSQKPPVAPVKTPEKDIPLPDLPLPMALSKVSVYQKEGRFDDDDQVPRAGRKVEAFQASVSGQWLLSALPLGLGLQFSMLRYEPGGFMAGDFRPHEVSGYELSFVTSYWQSFPSWKLAWQAGLILSSKLKAKGELTPRGVPYTTVQSRINMRSPGLQLAVEAHWPQYKLYSPFISLGLSMQGLEPEGTNEKSDFTTVLLGIGLAFEHHKS